MKHRLFWAVLLCAPAAQANPHALPFSYPYMTLNADELEFEQYVDMTPVKAFDSTGEEGFTPRSVLTTEFEYGLTDHLELGLYFQLSSDPGSSTGEAPLRFDGIKQRLRLRFAELYEWPVDVAVYAEIAELRNEIELEAKLIFEKRLGRFQNIINLWAEREFYYSGRSEWVLHPTAGSSFEVTPAVHVGLEYWMHAEFGEGGGFNADPHHYVGPTLLLHFTRFWWALAPYVRLDDWERSSALGDQFGRLWFRTIIGIER